MHDRNRLGMMPGNLLVRDLPAGLSNHLERRVADANRVSLRQMSSMSLQELVAGLPRLLAEELERSVASLPVDGHDDAPANAHGAELMRQIDNGVLTPAVLPE